MATACTLTIPTNWVAIMPVNIRTTGFVGGEKTNDSSFVVDEGDHNTGFTILLVYSPDILIVGKFDPGGAISLDDVLV